MKKFYTNEVCPKCDSHSFDNKFMPQKVEHFIYDKTIYGEKDYMLRTCSSCGFKFKTLPFDGINKDNEERAVAAYVNEYIFQQIPLISKAMIKEDPRLKKEVVVVYSIEEAKKRDEEIKLFKESEKKK